jgi:hypothetical protein
MMHPTKWARARPFHHMRFGVGDYSMIFFEKKKSLFKPDFGLLLLLLA